ncbi:hypothetical protein MTR_4g065930, partial [Medicago truncatula]
MLVKTAHEGPRVKPNKNSFWPPSFTNPNSASASSTHLLPHKHPNSLVRSSFLPLSLRFLRFGLDYFEI